jgi:hypothetical protein
MKIRNLAAVLIATLPFAALLADDVPKPFTFARYQAMLDRSPFAVATAVAAPSATPNFAKDLYVANAAHSKDGDYVTIASSADKNFKKYLSTNAAEDGYRIVNIEWSDKVGATKVTISKDDQTATLSFNEALLKQPVATSQSQPPVQQPNIQAQPMVPAPVPNTTPYPVRPAPVPQLPTPPPRVRGVIPKNPNAATTPVVAPTPEVEL